MFNAIVGGMVWHVTLAHLRCLTPLQLGAQVVLLAQVSFETLIRVLKAPHG